MEPQNWTSIQKPERKYMWYIFTQQIFLLQSLVIFVTHLNRPATAGNLKVEKRISCDYVSRLFLQLAFLFSLCSFPSLIRCATGNRVIQCRVLHFYKVCAYRAGLMPAIVAPEQRNKIAYVGSWIHAIR